LTSTARGPASFERVTGENIRKRLAIVLDNKVYSAPVIQDRIAGGQAVITGNFSAEEAEDLAIVLRAGALPAPVDIMEERTVGPSLGKATPSTRG
jgi:preprotein translocase subunit SecD